ncbi:MAG: serine/threonine-protein kinase [Bacteroidia bacterium]
MNLPGLGEKYEIIRTLGEGGMGVVYLAIQKRIERKVAIKSIAPYLARDPVVRERFTAEAAVLARLNHPNIVTLYDYVEGEDALYLIMEYVEGQPLSELLRGGPLHLELIQRYFLQVLEAFAYAHEQNVVHRDIKPSNIMITAGGRVKILDFGVARIIQTDQTLTRTGMRLGTLLYMSPEQVKGLREIDHRSDIYSLGVVLYEMLTGRPPYPADLSEFDLSVKIVQEPLFDLSRPPAEIPARLIEVILRATEKNPDFRYLSCEEFRKDFEQALSGTKNTLPPSPTQISSPPSPDRSSAQRKLPLSWILGAGILILTLGGVGWYLWGPKATPTSDTTKDTLRGPIVSPSSTEQAVNRTTEPSSDTQVDRRISESSSAASPPPTSVKPPSSSKKTPPPKWGGALAPSSPPKGKPKPIIQAEVQNFKEGTLFQKAKGTLILRNVGEGDADSVKVVVFFINKGGKVQYADTLTIASIKAGGYISRPLQARENGIKSLRVEILSSFP